MIDKITTGMAMKYVTWEIAEVTKDLYGENYTTLELMETAIDVGRFMQKHKLNYIDYAMLDLECFSAFAGAQGVL